MLKAMAIAIDDLARMLVEQQPGADQSAVEDWRRLAHFIELAGDDGFDINQHAAAVLDRDRLVWACTAVRSPGRTSILVMAPLPRNMGPAEQSAAGDALRLMVQLEHERDVALVQALLPPVQAVEGELLIKSGFARLAELIYLQGPLPTATQSDPPGLSVLSFSQDIEPRFAAVIRASYENTLDCPGLEGVRRMDDVLAGHRGSGVFRPDLWFMYRQADRDIGVILLNEVADRSHNTIELVYMGLVQSARGRGFGRAMLEHAIARARQAGYRRILTAVDSQNVPAIKLYCGHGMSETIRRVAYILPQRRDSGEASASPANQVTTTR